MVAYNILVFCDLASFLLYRITQTGWLVDFTGMDNNSVGAGYVGDNNDMVLNLRKIWKPDRVSAFQSGLSAGAY